VPLKELPDFDVPCSAEDSLSPNCQEAFYQSKQTIESVKSEKAAELNNP
jgi:hypothetical protein